MKLRMVVEIEVDDRAIAETYDEYVRAAIDAQDIVAIGQLALDCFHARCSGGSWRLAASRRVTRVDTEVLP